MRLRLTYPQKTNIYCTYPWREAFMANLFVVCNMLYSYNDENKHVNLVIMFLALASWASIAQIYFKQNYFETLRETPEVIDEESADGLAHSFPVGAALVLMWCALVSSTLTLCSAILPGKAIAGLIVTMALFNALIQLLFLSKADLSCQEKLLCLENSYNPGKEGELINNNHFFNFSNSLASLVASSAHFQNIFLMVANVLLWKKAYNLAVALQLFVFIVPKFLAYHDQKRLNAVSLAMGGPEESMVKAYFSSEMVTFAAFVIFLASMITDNNSLNKASAVLFLLAQSIPFFGFLYLRAKEDTRALAPRRGG